MCTYLEQTMVRARTMELYLYERTNIPGNSERTWTLFHHLQIKAT